MPASLAEIQTAEVNVRDYLTSLTTYITGASTAEPDLTTLVASLSVVALTTTAGNSVQGSTGRSTGVVYELVDRINSIVKESNLVQMTQADIYLAGDGDISNDAAIWSNYLLRSSNTYSGNDPTLKT